MTKSQAREILAAVKPINEQKCLVHFVRDIDDDLLKNPLDDELRVWPNSLAMY